MRDFVGEQPGNYRIVRLLNKIGVSSRSAATRYAIEHRLV